MSKSVKKIFLFRGDFFSEEIRQIQAAFLSRKYFPWNGSRRTFSREISVDTFSTFHRREIFFAEKEKLTLRIRTAISWEILPKNLFLAKREKHLGKWRLGTWGVNFCSQGKQLVWKISLRLKVEIVPTLSASPQFSLKVFAWITSK